MLPSTIELLRDILREAEFLEAQTAATTRDAFLCDEVLKRAFVRSVEVIGEAVRKVPEETRSQFPALEWKKMAGIAVTIPGASRVCSRKSATSFQFLNGFPVLRVCLMRSMVFGSLHRLKKTSRSRSMMYCSDTKCSEVKSPPHKM